MTRRSTIGDNPLDAIGASAPAMAPAAQATGENRSPKKNAVKSGPDTEASQSKPEAAGARWPHLSFRLRRIRITGGDATPGITHLSPARPGESSRFILPKGELVDLKRDVVRIDVQTEETTRRIDSLLAWATAGAFLAGPLGALAGSLYGGRERHAATIDIRLHDGRHILAVTDSETSREMQHALQ